MCSQEINIILLEYQQLLQLVHETSMPGCLQSQNIDFDPNFYPPLNPKHPYPLKGSLYKL